MKPHIRSPREAMGHRVLNEALCLLRHGASLEALNKEGRTPLMIGTSYDRKNLREALKT